MTTLNLSSNDIEQIYKTAKLLNEKYEASFFTVDREECGGIGYTLDITFSHMIPDLGMVSTSVSLVDVENW